MKNTLLVIATLAACVIVRAGQVIHDGTVGPAGAVTGPNFVIPDTAGTTRGNNLFHSFSQFNLDTGDSATFTGPANIHNILARVTGGSPSTIDGTIDTTGMPNANFFFINPFGVIFGPNAVINVSGSFAVTTADHVKLADGGRFDARNPANDLLTAAPVSAFGFLGPTAAPITFNGPTDPSAAFILAYLPDGKSIWIVGGDIQHQGSYLAAPGGEIVLVSVASAGELAVNVDDPRASVVTEPFFATLGTITLNNATEYVDGTPGGQVVMEANRISFANNSGISDGNSADTTGGDIILRARSEIDISQSTVGSVASGNGDSGNFFLTAPTIQLTGIALGETTLGNGRAGNVVITANNFSFIGGGGINVASQGAGAGGNLTIIANNVLIHGSTLLAQGLVSGPPGSITIQGKTTEQANSVELLAGGRILSDVSAGGLPGGTIHITAKSLTIDDQHGSGLTSISSQSESGGGGGGNIILDVGRLEVLNGAQVTAVTQNSAPAGNVTIHGNDVLVAGRQSHHGQGSVITSASEADGAAGGLTLQLTGSLTLRDGGLLSVSAAQSAGGDITVNAGGDIRLTDSQITGLANNDGGNVRLAAPSLIYLLNSTVTAASTAGNGGNAFLDPTLVVLNHSTVAANAIRGNGGNISIVSAYFLNSDTLLNASSEFGLQGSVVITAPSLDLAGNFLQLPGNLLDAGSLLTPHCAIRRPRGASSFTSAGRGALPATPDGLLPALPE